MDHSNESFFPTNDPEANANMASHGGVPVGEMAKVGEQGDNLNDTGWQNDPKYSEFLNSGEISRARISTKGDTDRSNPNADMFANEVELKDHFDKKIKDEEVIDVEGTVENEQEETKEEKKQEEKLYWVDRDGVWINIPFSEVRDNEMISDFEEGKEPKVGDKVFIRNATPTNNNASTGNANRGTANNNANTANPGSTPNTNPNPQPNPQPNPANNAAGGNTRTTNQTNANQATNTPNNTATGAPEAAQNTPPAPEPVNTANVAQEAERVNRENKQKALDYLDDLIGLPKDSNRQELIRSWLTRHGSEMTPGERKKAMEALGQKESGSKEIPQDPKEFKKFMRLRIREIIENETDNNKLNLNTIEQILIANISREIGLTQGGRMELYPAELGVERNRVMEKVRQEIQARANLKNLALIESRYRSYSDKNAALAKYMLDMKGSENNPANPSFITVETYRWLKNIDNLDDRRNESSTEKVDRALSVLLALGENKKGGEWWMEDFQDDINPNGPNYWETKYDPYQRARVDQKLNVLFGEDSVNLAKQLFAIYKEEGNYNKDHYLSSLFIFGKSRAGLAKSGTFAGSRRIYVSRGTDVDHRSYDAEIGALAVSPLNINAKVSETVDPNDPSKKIENKVPGFLKSVALSGRYLSAVNLDNPSFMKRPEEDSFSTVKKGVSSMEAIVNIGKLGEEQDKAGSIPKAIGYLAKLRENLQELVDAKVVDQATVDNQMKQEVLNCLFEMGTDNPNNMNSLQFSTRDKLPFLTPTKLAEFFTYLGRPVGVVSSPVVNNEEKRFSGVRKLVSRMRGEPVAPVKPVETGGFRIITDKRTFEDIRTTVQLLRAKSLDVIKGDGLMDIDAEKDGALKKKEKDSWDSVILPKDPGNNYKTKRKDLFLKIITFPFELPRKILSYIPFFGKMFEGKLFK